MNRRNAFLYSFMVALIVLGLSGIWEFGFKDDLLQNFDGVWLTPIISAAIAGLAAAMVSMANLRGRSRILNEPKFDEHYYKAIFEFTQSLIFVKDIDSRFLIANRRFLEFYNVTAEEVIGQRSHSWLGHEQCELSIAQDSDIIRTPKPIMLEFQTTNENGQVRWIRSHKFPVFDENDVVTGVGGIGIDITETKLAEAAIKANDERYRLLFEHSPDAMFVHVNDQIVFVNNATVRLFGALTSDRLLGIHASDLFHPDDKQKILNLRRRTMGGTAGMASVREFRIIKLNGEEICVQCTASKMEWDNKPAMIVILRDMSHQKAAEQALLESGELYRNMIELSADAIYMQKDGRINFMNAAGLKLFGAGSLEEVIGLSSLDFTHPDYHAEVKRLRMIPSHERENRTTILEQQRLRLDGSVFWSKTIVTPFTWKGSRSALVVVRDISERKRAEEELRMSEERYQELVERSQAAILVNNGAEILYANAAAVNLYGAETSENLIGRDPNELVHPDERKDVLERHRLVIENGFSSHTKKQKRLRLDGSSILTEISSNRVRWNGQTCVLIEVRDITPRHKAEHDLLIAKESAELANRTKTEFLANMSHELRTPLNAVIGFSQIMESELLGSIGNVEYKGYCRDIHQSGLHLLKLINDILDISKIEAGKLELYEEEFDPVKAIESCVRLINERAVSSNIDLAVKVQQELPQIRADERKVKQILINLLSNAVKFTPEGGKYWLKPRPVRIQG